MNKAEIDNSKEWAEALITGNLSKEKWKHLEHILIETAQYFLLIGTPDSFEEFISNDEAPVLSSENGEQARLTDFPVNPNDATLGDTDLVPNGVPENGFQALKHYYETGHIDRQIAEEWVDWNREKRLEIIQQEQ